MSVHVMVAHARLAAHGMRVPGLVDVSVIVWAMEWIVSSVEISIRKRQCRLGRFTETTAISGSSATTTISSVRESRGVRVSVRGVASSSRRLDG